MGYLNLTGLSRFYTGLKGKFLLQSNVANNLTTTAAGKALDARQGAALKTLVNANTANISTNALNLGKSASPYIHTKSGTTHNLAGSGALGYAVLTADFTDGDTFTVNGTAITEVIGNETEIKDEGALLFSISGTTLYLYAVANEVPTLELLSANTNAFNTIGYTTHDTEPTVVGGELVLTITDTDNYWSYINYARTDLTVDLSDYQTLEVHLSERSVTGYCRAGIIISQNALSGTVVQGSGVSGQLRAAVNAEITTNHLTIDVSGYTGSYYIYIILTTGVQQLPAASATDTWNGSGTIRVEYVQLIV